MRKKKCVRQGRSPKRGQNAQTRAGLCQKEAPKKGRERKGKERKEKERKGKEKRKGKKKGILRV
jgi:hypothetical protein